MHKIQTNKKHKSKEKEKTERKNWQRSDQKTQHHIITMDNHCIHFKTKRKNTMKLSPPLKLHNECTNFKTNFKCHMRQTQSKCAYLSTLFLSEYKFPINSHVNLSYEYWVESAESTSLSWTELLPSILSIQFNSLWSVYGQSHRCDVWLIYDPLYDTSSKIGENSFSCFSSSRHMHRINS